MEELVSFGDEIYQQKKKITYSAVGRILSAGWQRAPNEALFSTCSIVQQQKVEIQSKRIPNSGLACNAFRKGRF